MVTVAAVAVSVPSDRSVAGGSPDPAFLFYSGTDFWRYGAFLYGGFLWSPAGQDHSGFTLKTLVAGGNFEYVSSGLGELIDGTKLSAAILPGWRFSRGRLTVSLFAGPTVQDYRLTPNDPGSLLHGFYLGAQADIDIWYQPSAATMAALDGSIASIGPTGYVRAAFGYRAVPPAFVGPEVEAIWCGDFDELEFGGHLTGLHVDALEWSMGSGWAMTSDRRSGPYLRLGVDARY
jgi:hypothetical protein